MLDLLQWLELIGGIGLITERTRACERLMKINDAQSLQGEQR